MTIQVQCSGCGTKLRAPQSAAGKRKSCPKCGKPITIPLPDAEADPGDGLNLYELALEPSAPSRPKDTTPDSVIVSRSPKPGVVTAAKEHKSDEPDTARFGAYATAIAAEARKHQTDEKAALLTVLGIDITVGRLAGLGLLVLVLCFGGIWWTMYGPGRTHALLGVRPVYVTVALDRGQIREPYSLLTMQGDMSVGIKGGGEGVGPIKAGPAASMFKSATGAVWSLGSGDQLVVTRDGRDGDHLFVEVELSRALMSRLNQTARYDVVFRADQFVLGPSDGSQPRITPRIVYADFDGRVDIDLIGARTTDHRALLPPGAPPTREQLQRAGNLVTGGNVHYNGEAGIRGDLDFRVHTSPDAAVPTTGFSADGNLKLTDPGGAVVDMQYQSGEVVVSWNAGSHGHWTRESFTEPQGDIPFTRYRVGLIFPRPYTDKPLSLTYAGKHLGTLDRRHNATDPTRGAGGGGVGVTTYFSLLAQARDKARGTIADSNMVQIALAIQMYTDRHRGRLPDRIEDLASIMPGIEGVLLNPRTGERPGYVYVKPAESLAQVKDPANTVLIYESRDGRIDPDGSKLYADGRIEQRGP